MYTTRGPRRRRGEDWGQSYLVALHCSNQATSNPYARVAAAAPKMIVSLSLHFVTVDEVSARILRGDEGDEPKMTLLPSFHMDVTTVSPG